MGETTGSPAPQADERPAPSSPGRQPTQSEVHHGASHGNSVAAWTAVGIVLLGSAIACAGVMVATLWVFIVGVVVIAAGAVVGKVLSAMGFGSTVHEDPATSTRQGTR